MDKKVPVTKKSRVQSAPTLHVCQQQEQRGLSYEAALQSGFTSLNVFVGSDTAATRLLV